MAKELRNLSFGDLPITQTSELYINWNGNLAAMFEAKLKAAMFEAKLKAAIDNRKSKKCPNFKRCVLTL